MILNVIKLEIKLSANFTELLIYCIMDILNIETHILFIILTFFWNSGTVLKLCLIFLYMLSIMLLTDIVFKNNTCECIAHSNKHTTELLNTRRAAVTYYMMENLLYLYRITLICPLYLIN